MVLYRLSKKLERKLKGFYSLSNTHVYRVDSFAFLSQRGRRKFTTLMFVLYQKVNLTKRDNFSDKISDVIGA